MEKVVHLYFVRYDEGWRFLHCHINVLCDQDDVEYNYLLGWTA